MMDDEVYIQKGNLSVCTNPQRKIFQYPHFFRKAQKRAAYEKTERYLSYNAANTLNLAKWKPTILLPGILAEKQLPRIVKCFARTITEENRENKNVFTTKTPPNPGCS
jgi:hypothetical protein